MAQFSAMFLAHENKQYLGYSFTIKSRGELFSDELTATIWSSWEQNTKALNPCGGKHKTQVSPSYGASRSEVESLGKNKRKALILFP